MNWLSPEVEISKDSVTIDINYDLLKVNKQSVDDLSASVLLVNNFFYPEGHQTSEQLRVPTEYFMKNKQLHNLFNRLLNTVFKNRTMQFDDETDRRMFYAL